MIVSSVRMKLISMTFALASCHIPLQKSMESLFRRYFLLFAEDCRKFKSSLPKKSMFALFYCVLCEQVVQKMTSQGWGSRVEDFMRPKYNNVLRLSFNTKPLYGKVARNQPQFSRLN